MCAMRFRFRGRRGTRRIEASAVSPLSSPRRRGPIATAVFDTHRVCQIAKTRRMGPRLRGDDNNRGIALLRLLRDRHWHAGDLHLEHAQTGTRAEIESLPVVAAEGHVGCVGKAMHDAAELLAVRVNDVEPARAAAINVAGAVDLHAVGNAWLSSAQIGE